MPAALPMSTPVPKSLLQQDAQLGLCPSFLQNHHCLDSVLNNLLDICSSYKEQIRDRTQEKIVMKL